MAHDYLSESEDEVVGDIPAMPEGRAALHPAAAGVNRDVLALPTHLTIVEVGAFHAELIPWLQVPGSIAIDGQAIETIDGAGIQLLAAFIRDALAHSDRVYWVNASDALIAAADQMGLHAALLLDQSLQVN